MTRFGSQKPGHVALIAIALASATLWSVPVVRAGDNGKREDGQGKYAELTADWWQWLLGEPASTSPLLDTTGDIINAVQPPGKVFFLVGAAALSPNSLDAIVELSVKVPAGQALFFPILNSEFANQDSNLVGYTVPQLRELAASLPDSATDLYLRLDGIPLPGAIVRVKSPTFSYTLPAVKPPDMNIFQFFGLDLPPGVIRPVVSDGYWAYLPPLSNDRVHLLEYGGSAFGGSFKLAIIYHITITSP